MVQRTALGARSRGLLPLVSDAGAPPAETRPAWLCAAFARRVTGQTSLFLETPGEAAGGHAACVDVCLASEVVGCFREYPPPTSRSTPHGPRHVRLKTARPASRRDLRGEAGGGLRVCLSPIGEGGCLQRARPAGSLFFEEWLAPGEKTNGVAQQHLDTRFPTQRSPVCCVALVPPTGNNTKAQLPIYDPWSF